jgi:hypothetical protein
MLRWTERGPGSISVSVGNGSGDSDEDIVVRIKPDEPGLRPDEPVRAAGAPTAKWGKVFSFHSHKLCQAFREPNDGLRVSRW